MSSSTASSQTSSGHPAGLWVLFTTEMWERFAYYAMRAILVLYLISETTKQTAPGLGWSEANAYTLYGWYTGLVYLTPLLGGYLADKFFGQRFSVIIGAVTMAAGQFFLASTELVRNACGGEVNFAVNAIFFAGLTLMVLGNGFFKPNISVMVGQMYGPNEHAKRDSAFTIFYMGINIGAFFSPLVAGTLGENFGYEYGFFAAGIGMLFGLTSFTVFGKHIKELGKAPVKTNKEQDVKQSETSQLSESSANASFSPLEKKDYDKIWVIIILTVFSIAFFLTFEQAGSSLNVFAKDRTDRAVSTAAENVLPNFITSQFIADEGKKMFPASWYQSVNPLGIIIFAPLFAMLWTTLARWRFEPSTPVKFALGLLLVSCGYLIMIPGAIEAQKAGLAAAYWLLGTYVLQTWGELCLSPVGLSMVTKLAPHRYQSQLMGCWLLGSCFAQILGGYVAAVLGTAGGVRIFFGENGGLADFFLILSAIPFVIGIVALIMSPMLKRMMHGVN